MGTACGIVNLPGVVLAGAVDLCPELPGVRSAVAAGYQSIGAKAAMNLNAHVEELAELDLRVDEALCRVRTHSEACARASSSRQIEAAQETRHAVVSSLRALVLLGCCVLAACMERTYMLAVLVPLSAWSVDLAVVQGRAWVARWKAHARSAVFEREALSDLKVSLRVSQTMLEGQRRVVAEAKEELIRARSSVADVVQKGPSLKDAVAVSSHLASEMYRSFAG